ncbi:hypothetical protein GE061_012324 [Apolygus lucorum]|uniref:Uncharacterized protein n=1 Tax=Apolygus lucorum TaxID=248454 RepID=A0A6A4JY94_APOLU|nr:hypothetical protein GE061_012324 [Apolygus lucorum]
MENVDTVKKMASDGGQTVTLFGKPVNLEQEWHQIAANLGSLCEGHRYIDYDKEIARLKLKVIHLQEEVNGCKAHNKNLSSMNDDLVYRVRDLISMQDKQLEQYSTALVLLTEERRDLWHTLSASQKNLKKLQEQLCTCKCSDEVPAKDSSDETDSVGSSQDIGTNTENTEEVASRIRRNQFEESAKRTENELQIENTTHVKSLADELALPVSEKTAAGRSRNLDSFESSIESNKSAELVRNGGTPFKPKGLFVNSMIEKIEKKHKLKSFDESHAIKNDDEDSLPERESLQSEEAELMRTRISELEQEVSELRETCETLSGMLERTYDEILPTDTRDDVKDQLIACLRSRLFEAICDLMKVEKSRSNVKSVACGSSLPRAPKAPDLSMAPPAPPSSHATEDRLATSQSDPVISPSRSRASKILASPASKLRALREDHYSKLRKFSCWNPKTPEDSA